MPLRCCAPSEFTARMASMAASISKIVPTTCVPDVAQALEWYTPIGFKEVARYEDDGMVTSESSCSEVRNDADHARTALFAKGGHC